MVPPKHQPKKSETITDFVELFICELVEFLCKI